MAINKKKTATTESTTAELSVREKEVLQGASKGLKTKQIAEKLFISPATVETHKINIYRKLQVSNITDAVVTALKKNWIE